MKKMRGLSLILIYLALPQMALSQEVVEVKRVDDKWVTMAVYRPKQDCQGIAIISHGAGGSENGYAFLAKALQAQDWLSVVPGHQESGIAGLRQHMNGKGIRAALASLITDNKAYLGRFMDIQAALNLARQHCPAKPQVMIGHSMGAATTMLAAGALNRLQLETPTFNFDAYIALSPQGVGSIFPPHAWQHIQHKVLLMTGTRDTDLGGANWQTRLDAFRDMSGPCKWSAVIDGATHMSFAGNTNSDKEKSLITNTILQFIQHNQQRSCPLPNLVGGINLSSK
jgi:predicted dienelactone hydrolase